MTLKEKIIMPVMVAGMFSIVGTATYLETKAIESNGGKIVNRQLEGPTRGHRQIIPQLCVYDDNVDGKADRTIVRTPCGFGETATIVSYERRPTQAEIDWYKISE